jgi:hypothetical protein
MSEPVWLEGAEAMSMPPAWIWIVVMLLAYMMLVYSAFAPH